MVEPNFELVGDPPSRAGKQACKEWYPKFWEALNEVLPSTRGNKYTQFAREMKSLCGFELEYGGYSASENASALISQIKRGNGRTVIHHFLKWYWRRHNDKARQFFELHGLSHEPGFSPTSGIISIEHNSPVTLEKLLLTAKSSLTLISSSHWTLAGRDGSSSNKNWGLVQQAYRRGVKLRIVAMHPDLTANSGGDAIAVWSRYMSAGAFADQLSETWKRFSKWREAYLADKDANHHGGSLTFFKAFLNPTALSVVDADRADGFAVVSPRIQNRMPDVRPQFIVKKMTDLEAFSYYNLITEDAFANRDWLDAFAS